MFAEKKLVILRNVFLNTKFQEDFLEHSKGLEELKDIIIVYEEDAVDQRKKIFKSLIKNAKCQEFVALSPLLLRKWAQEEWLSLKADIDPMALDLLISFVGNDLWRMSGEIHKLANYKKGSMIIREDVVLLVKPLVENDIFKTIDALAQKNKKQALYLLSRHVEAGDAPIYLISMIAYQFKSLLIIKELIDQRVSFPLLAKQSGLHPFVVKKNFYLCNQFSLVQLKDIYKKIFQIDSDIKIGKIEPETALQLLVASI